MQVLKRKSRVRKVVAQIVNRVHDCGRIPIATLALEFGYSLMYFKYQVVPLVKQMTPCIEVEGDNLVWTCEDSVASEGVVQ